MVVATALFVGFAACLLIFIRKKAGSPFREAIPNDDGSGSMPFYDCPGHR